MTRTILRAAALTLALPVLAACATASPAPDQEAVRYDSPHQARAAERERDRLRSERMPTVQDVRRDKS